MKEPYQFLASMICRLYGEEKCTHFKLEWTPIAHYVAEKGHVFNWAQLLSINIFETTKGAPGPKQPGFFMSSYLLDVVCASNCFPGMGWYWNPTSFPIHVYCFQLWEKNYRRHFYDICDNFMAPLYVMIYNQNPLRLSPKSMQVVKDIGDWYIGKYYTYVRIYGCASAPHLLPKYIPDKLVVREIAYQDGGGWNHYIPSFQFKKVMA
jgi:hypothetical protein